MKIKILNGRFKMFLITGIFIFFVAPFTKLIAQESMIPEVSATYLGKLIDIAKKNYVIVKINEKRIDLANINIQKANVSWFDIFSITLNYSPSGSTSLNQPTYSGFQIGLYINFGSLLSKPYLVKLSKEELEIAKLGKQDALNILEGEVKARYIKYVQTSVLLRVESKISLETENVVKEARYKFEKGEVTFETFTRALIFEADYRKKVIDAEANLLTAKASLETIIGKKISEIK
ncbi:MAG: TolC family protein [Bacteroidota bacterium]